MTGIDRLLRESAIAPADIGRLVHATTLFSNALIERKGAPTGLITTKGFRDTLEIGRERKYELYDIRIVKPAPAGAAPPAPGGAGADDRRRQRAHAARRGRRARRRRARSTAEGVTSLAIVFLHSYANPAHERQAAELLAKHHPGLTLSASIEVAPEIREYERVSTTVINAYIKPLAERYISALSDRIAARGITAPLLLMLSNGGLTNIEEAKRTPVQLLESGPAAGALVAAHLGAVRRRQPRAGLRHGRHHRQALDHRRRQAHGRLQLRGRAREALRRGQRPAGAHLDAGADRDRRRRRLHRPSRRHRPAEGRAHQRRLRAWPRRLRAGRQGADRHRRRLRAGLSQSGLFRRRHHGHRHGRGRSRHAAAGGARGAQRRRPRLGHPRRRQREHGERGARAHRRARQGPTPLRAAVHRRRRPRARLLRRQEAGPCAG